MKPSLISPRRPFLAAALAALGIALAGCATTAPASPEQAVKARATEYWQARIAGQYEKAYALSTPSYRKLRSAQQFKEQFGSGASVKTAEVVAVSCEPEKCTTRVKLGVSPAALRMKLDTIATHKDETWLFEDGQWWHHQDL